MSYASVGQLITAEYRVNKLLNTNFLLFLNFFISYLDASRNCNLAITQLFSLEETKLRASEMPETFFTIA
jgi:hypothetical protein